MNIFKQCLFRDGLKKSIIEIEDIIEDNYLNSKSNFFYVMFYFTAAWLPENHDSLNENIRLLYQERKKNFDNFELIFISSDKSVSDFKKFLKLNKFIRYSLEFSDQDLKVQLGKFFNTHSLPYVSVVRFELDKNLKIIEQYSEKTNCKNFILSNQPKFPWFEYEENLDTPEMNKEPSILDELLININRININEYESIETIESIKSYNNFIYILFMSNQIETKKHILKSFVQFDRKYSKKHKFIFVYISLDKIDRKVLAQTDWYTTNSNDLKNKLLKHYEVTHVPKLLILDIKTGEILNKTIEDTLTDLIYEVPSFSSIRQFNPSSGFLKLDIVDELKKNISLISDDTITGTNNNLLNFYLLYFCSYSTSIANIEIYKQVVSFVSQMQNESKCAVKMVLISSDNSIDNYNQLINEFYKKKVENENELKKFALNFDSKILKEKIFKELKIFGIPWFLLLNADSGEILCENLKAFIFNNKYSDVVF